MGRLVVCNNEDIFYKISNENIGSGLKSSGKHVGEKIFLETYSKLRLSSFNFLNIGDDFIACSGSLLYQGKMGIDCLKSLYDDFSEEKISDIRKNAIGTYVVAIKKGKQVFIFIDEVGTYAYHYYLKNEIFISTNTYYHIAKCVETNINKLAFKERIIEFCNIDNATIFNDIYRLNGNEAIMIDMEDNHVHVIDVPQNHYEFDMKVDVQSIASDFVDIIIKYAKIYQRFGRRMLFTTGGVDSRVILSIYNYLGEKPMVANWQGCPFEMNTKIPDRIISKQLADACGLKFIPFDVSHDFRTDCENIDGMFSKYGEYSLIYCGNSKWYEIFEKNNIDSYDFGYFGETIKGWEPLDEQYHEHFSIEDYVKLYLNKNINVDKDAEFKEYVRKKILAIAEEYGMDLDNISQEDCMKLYYVYRVHADTLCSNFTNMFAYSSNLFAEKEIIDYINQIPYKIKADNHFNLTVTKILNKKLLDVPYFTHCHYKKCDKEKMILVNPRINIIEVVKKIILQTSIGKYLKKFKNKALNVDNSSIVSAMNLLDKTSFETDTGISLKRDSDFIRLMPCDLVGYACFIQNVLHK